MMSAIMSSDNVGLMLAPVTYSPTLLVDRQINIKMTIDNDKYWQLTSDVWHGLLADTDNADNPDTWVNCVRWQK